MALDLLVEHLEGAAQQAHGPVGEAAGAPAFNLGGPPSEAGDGVVALVELDGGASDGGQAVDAGAALAGRLAGQPRQDPRRLHEAAGVGGKDDDGAAAETASEG